METDEIVQKQLDSALLKCCLHNDLAGMQNLLTSPSRGQHANINAFDGEILLTACSKGYLEIVQYLLTSSEITQAGAKHAQMKDHGLIYACMNGHDEVVRFLLTAPQILACGGRHADIHIEKDWCFKHYYSTHNKDMLDFFMVDAHIPMTEEISALCQGTALQKTFEKRDFATRLAQELPVFSSTPSRKTKM